MAKLKRVLLMALILLGPGLIIYFIAKTVSNHFIELPYLGYEYILDSEGNKIDSTAYRVPDFELTSFDGTPITRDSIDGKFIVLTTIQNDCPDQDLCGMSVFHFNEIFFHKLVKNQENYSNVKVISILTDVDGNPVSSPSEKLIEEMEEYNKSIWWMTTGEVMPFYNFNYYGDKFINYAATPDAGEVGAKAFTNSLVLIDDKGHIRGVSDARTDTGIRNFFDMLKLLKKEEFDRNHAEKNNK